MPDEIDRAREALSKTPTYLADDRPSWIKVGMAAHAVSDSLLPEWIEWSRHSEKFKEGECERMWRGFRRDKSAGIGLGTLIRLARDGNTAPEVRPSTAPPRLRPYSSVDNLIAGVRAMTGGKHAGTWIYEHADGNFAFGMVRLDLPGKDKNGKTNKTFRPFHQVDGGYVIGTPRGPLPLYRRPKLVRGRVLMSEGEKSADAAASLGFISTTSAHGASSTAKTDFSPLAGSEVVVLADNDTAGESYVEAIKQIVFALKPAATLRVVRLPGLPPGGDVVEFLAAQQAAGRSEVEIKAEIEALIEKAQPERAPTPSPSASAARKSRRRLSKYVPFPVHHLPEPLRAFVLRSSTSIGCDPVAVVLPALAALASAIGNTRRIRLKHGWTEAMVLWTLLVAYSGTQKTPALSLIRRALDEIQQRAFRVHDEETARYEEQLAYYEIAKREWSRNAEGAPPVKPIEPTAERCYTADPTIEALAMLLKDRWRGLLLMRDELSGWLSSFDRYSHGQGGDVAYWLEMHGGQSIVIDRKTGKPRTIALPRASVSITGCIQPRVLARALGVQHFENGLAARFLAAFPPKRTRCWTDDDIPPECEEKFRRLLARLYDLREDTSPEGEPIPRDVDLSPEAKELFVAFFNEHGEQQSAMTGKLAATWSKLEGYAARLALLHHLVRWAADEAIGPTIDAESMRAGIALSRWFGCEAKRVYAIVGDSEEEQELRQLAEIVQAQKGSISVRDWQRLRTHETAELAEEELGRLVDADLGEWSQPSTKPQGGRPFSKVFVLDSEALEALTPARDEPEGVVSETEVADDNEVSDENRFDTDDELEPEGQSITPSDTTLRGDSLEGVVSEFLVELGDDHAVDPAIPKHPLDLHYEETPCRDRAEDSDTTPDGDLREGVTPSDHPVAKPTTTFDPLVDGWSEEILDRGLYEPALCGAGTDLFPVSDTTPEGSAPEGVSSEDIVDDTPERVREPDTLFGDDDPWAGRIHYA